jgi:hypothetical protein
MARTKYSEIISQTVDYLLSNVKLGGTQQEIDTSKFATKDDISNLMNSIKSLNTSVQNIEKTLNEFKKGS